MSLSLTNRLKFAFQILRNGEIPEAIDTMPYRIRTLSQQHMEKPVAGDIWSHPEDHLKEYILVLGVTESGIIITEYLTETRNAPDSLLAGMEFELAYAEEVPLSYLKHKVFNETTQRFIARVNPCEPLPERFNSIMTKWKKQSTKGCCPYKDLNGHTRYFTVVNNYSQRII